jgi:lysophospholipase L1-like esterase
VQPSSTFVRRFGQTGLALLLAAGGLVGTPGLSAAGTASAGRAVPSTHAAGVNPGGTEGAGWSLDVPLRIMPLGDSLTWGKGSSDGSGYRVDLHSWLEATGVVTDFVGSQHNGSGPDLDHEGHPGWRIAEIGAHVDQWVPQAAPDVILLDIGTNDLLHHDAVAEAPARLAALLDRLIVLAPQARIVLARLLVVRADFRGFNAALGRIAADRPGHVWLADMSGISPAETVDHVHPTDLGYRWMAAEWYRALSVALPGGQEWKPAPDSPAPDSPAPDSPAPDSFLDS